MDEPFKIDWIKINIYEKITFNNEKFYIKKYDNNNMEFKYLDRDKFKYAYELYKNI